MECRRIFYYFIFLDKKKEGKKAAQLKATKKIKE
jgi:hypothetical protein